MYEELAKRILYGAFYGGQVALIGYLKSEGLKEGWKATFTKEFWVFFDPVKALKTVFIGSALGAFGIVQQEYDGYLKDPILVNFLNDAIVMGADQLVKLIVRRTPLVNLWNRLKEEVAAYLFNRL